MKQLLSLWLFLSVHSSLFAVKDTSFTVLYGTIPVTVYVKKPAFKSEKTLLLLHGWNLKANEWCTKSNLCDKALAQGWTVVLPEFGKTTYHWQNYPETIEKYRKYPTRQWMYDSLFVRLQRDFHLLRKGSVNFVAGISTGGRGAALFALEHPEIFIGAACLSADFDQSKIAGEPINTGYYGSYSRFPERWKGKDNIYLRANEFSVPVLLIHGKQDKMCPVSQSEDFYKELKRLHPALKTELIIDPTGQHNYQLWTSNTDKIILFFSSLHK